MHGRTFRRVKALVAVWGAGIVLGPVSCVQGVADTVGNGLAWTSSAGLGVTSQTVAVLSSGIGFLADLVRFLPLI